MVVYRRLIASLRRYEELRGKGHWLSRSHCLTMAVTTLSKPARTCFSVLLTLHIGLLPVSDVYLSLRHCEPVSKNNNFAHVNFKKIGVLMIFLKDFANLSVQ